MLFDIGVNLTASAFRDDREKVMQRAVDAGVTQFLLIGSHLEDSTQAIALTDQFAGCYATAGIHPHYASEFNTSSCPQISKLATHNKVRAIGETGLDFNRNYSTPSEQEAAFAAQLELACDLQLPVYLHQRDAHQRFLEILKLYRDRLPAAVAHCFTGTRDELHDCLDLDLHIGITGWICDERRGYHLHELIADIPANRLMLETDAPYLLPRTIKPKPKSRRNEPAYLAYVLKTVADCLGQTEEEVAQATTTTARRFFGID